MSGVDGVCSVQPTCSNSFASASAAHPSEGATSALASRLLHLWASGHLSAVSVRELAHLAED